MRVMGGRLGKMAFNNHQEFVLSVTICGSGLNVMTKSQHQWIWNTRFGISAKIFKVPTKL